MCSVVLVFCVVRPTVTVIDDVNQPLMFVCSNDTLTYYCFFFGIFFYFTFDVALKTMVYCIIGCKIFRGRFKNWEIRVCLILALKRSYLMSNATCYPILR